MWMFFAALPDLMVEIEAIIVERKRVAGRGIMRGTHQGEFMGIPATGRSVAVS
jgi:predicted ester cyclase